MAEPATDPTPDHAPARRLTTEEKDERAQRMYAFYQGPPERSLEEVGVEFGGLSKERIRQIFTEYGYQVRYPRPYHRNRPAE